MKESKEKKTSYPLVILAQTISTLLPIAGFVWWIYASVNLSQQYKTLFVVWDLNITIPMIVFIITLLQFLALRVPLKKLYHKALMDNEYDEFGMSKKKSYDKLTRKEREEMDAKKATQMEMLFSTSVLQKVVKSGSKDPEKDLDALIGIQPVKSKVEEMSARMKFERGTKFSKRTSRDNYNSSMSGRHMVFYGSAGTGKTTVARIITGFLYKYGYIKENKCVEINGSFLKAGEDSMLKTQLITRKAYGGVLFIDEAYTIIDGSSAYGKEVIGTLIKEMEDNRDRLIIILAGYKNDMKRLLDTNEGFKSRIKEYLEFPDYNIEEMKEIFVAMAHSEGYVVSEEALENFEVRCAKECKLSSFGNGRTARNILDETIDRHALNYGKGVLVRKAVVDGVEQIVGDNTSNKFVLCGCDVSTSVNKAVL